MRWGCFLSHSAWRDPGTDALRRAAHHGPANRDRKCPGSPRPRRGCPLPACRASRRRACSSSGTDTAGSIPVSQFGFAWPPAPNVVGASHKRRTKPTVRMSSLQLSAQHSACPVTDTISDIGQTLMLLPEPPAQAEQFSWRLRSGRTPRPANSLRLQITECRDDPTHPSGRHSSIRIQGIPGRSSSIRFAVGNTRWISSDKKRRT